MASWQEEIKNGQTIWADNKNGIIDGIDWKNKIVYVSFYDKGRGSYEFDDLIGNWDDALNQWVIVPF